MSALGISECFSAKAISEGIAFGISECFSAKASVQKPKSARHTSTAHTGEERNQVQAIPSPLVFALTSQLRASAIARELKLLCYSY